MESKLKEGTENLKRMRKQLEEMLGEIISLAKGNAEINHELPGAIADMIKDLAEAEEHVADSCKSEIEMEYKKKIMEAMDSAQYGKNYDEKGPLMGYTRMHYPDFEEWPREHYPIMGYTPDARYMGAGMDHFAGTGKMGYDSTVQDISGRGRNYDAYRDARRHYTSTRSPEMQKKMMDSRDRVFDEMEEMIMELWNDLDQSEKTKYMQKGQKLMSKLQGLA